MCIRDRYIEDYLMIQKTRFGERFQYEIEIEKECYQIPVPKLLLDVYKRQDDMLKALEAYELDGCWAIHLYAGLDSKKVSLQAGPRMSSVAGYDIRIVGRGGHGSRPDLCRNPAGCIVDIISLVPGMMKARLNPAYPVVFSIGEIHVGTKGNIIAEDGYFSGTLRYFDYEAGVKAMEILCSVSEEIARLHGCSVDYMRKIITDKDVYKRQIRYCFSRLYWWASRGQIQECGRY